MECKDHILKMWEKESVEIWKSSHNYLENDWDEIAEQLYVELIETRAKLNYHKEVKESQAKMLDERADEIYRLKVSLDEANKEIAKLQDRIDGYEDMLADGTPYKMTYRPLTDEEIESGSFKLKPNHIVREGSTLYINQSGKDLPHPSRKKVNVYSPDPE